MEMPGVLLKCFLTKNISTCANKRIPRKALKRKFFLSSGKNINSFLLFVLTLIEREMLFVRRARRWEKEYNKLEFMEVIMAFDFKKEYKEFYMPKNKPEIVNIPKANYIAVRGKGNPNEEGGAYQQAIGILYAVAYTLKMSYKTDYKIEGFFEYVVPPLEGFWWQDDVDGVDYADKSAFNWISVIRLPDFVSKENFDWAVETATKKKKLDCSSAEYLTIDEGLCVQIMHLGSFDDEPATVALMDAYLEQNGYVNDMNNERLHHEIYLSDARKVAPEKWKTVIRHPIRKL